MRKTVIALMLVLPMLFVLVIFSSVNIVSISVPVSVSGIRIYADGDPWQENDVLEMDHTNNSDRHIITAQVTPANASNKDYTLQSDNPEVLEVTASGEVQTHGHGTANIIATSKDGGYTDKIPVVVNAGLVYGINFTLFDSNGDVVPLNSNYSMPAAEKIKTGYYKYNITFIGGDSREYTLKNDENSAAYADVRVAEQGILLPFGGTVKLKLDIPNAYDGRGANGLSYDISLNVNTPTSETGILVNGEPDGAVTALTKGSTETVLFVQCDGEPTITGDGIISCECLTHGSARAAGSRQHLLKVNLNKSFSGDVINATLTANGKTVHVMLTFADFDFTLRGDNLKENVEGSVDYTLTVLKNTAVSLHAVPVAESQNVRFEWSVAPNGKATIAASDEVGQTASFKSTEDGSYTITVNAMREGELLDSKTVKVECVTKVNSVTITNNPKTDLAERYTIGGWRYNANLEKESGGYLLNLLVSKQGSAPVRDDATNIEFDSTDKTIADVEIRNNRAYIVAHGTDVVTITAKWAYRDTFNNVTSLTSDFTVNVVSDAIEVSNYPELRKATEDGQKVVLTKNIALGTNADYDASITMPTDRSSPTYQSDMQAYRSNINNVLPISQRQSIVDGHRYFSTYNTEWYKQSGNASEAFVKYAMEFKADVYGNGFNIDAEFLSNAQDGAGTPLIFRGPLVFVEYRGVATVAGQDNCSFLIRTDGVKLYGVNLLGCSDSSLLDDNGQYELNKLNKIGTTLEVNADCDIINCRIRNGRNVVRVYGGNSNGSSYQTLAIPAKDLDSTEQIVVKIEGCIITQGREFIVKVGTNKSLQASLSNGQEPKLTDERGVAYKENSKVVDGKTYYTNNYDVGSTDRSSFFYRRYVMTDLTIKNSVLETSGLFCVGVESNFSGDLLYEGASAMPYAKMPNMEWWHKSGGTSFASILRLEGDVRTYDWKDVAKVDSSTLIEATEGNSLSELMKFDVSAMLKEVDGDPDYARLLYREGSSTYVHGGIAFYGGGRNYSQIDLSGLSSSVNNLQHLSINIGQFANGEGVVARQAQLLPLAAGTHDFNFWMYTADCANNYAWQQNKSYDGVAKVPLF